MLALEQYRRGVGPCGFHHSLTADPDNAFTTVTETCTVCAGIEKDQRVEAERSREEEDALKGQPTESRSTDGKRKFVRQLTPAEIAEKKRSQARSARASRHRP